MTRIFVSEFLCGGGREEPARFTGWAPALLGEAWAMLSAACADFAAIRDIEVVTLLDARLPDKYALDPRVEVRRIEPEGEAEAFHRAAGESDHALVIAPEFDGILFERCRRAATAGAHLLGPTPDAVALTSDKLALGHHWQAAGVPTLPTVTDEPDFPLPWIVKPRFGAGSQGIEILRDAPRPKGALEPPSAPSGRGELQWIFQPLVAGVAASVSFLGGPRETIPLEPCAQNLDENFHYLGGSTPLPLDLANRAIAIARRAIECVPGLFGYVGVDIVLGGQDVAIEINPRLTTSYIGLRQLADGNIAEWLLRVVRGEPVKPRWRAGPIAFQV